jgi:hypothetical protein
VGNKWNSFFIRLARYLTLSLSLGGKMSVVFLCHLPVLLNDSKLSNGILFAIPDLSGSAIVNYSLSIVNFFPTGFT